MSFEEKIVSAEYLPGLKKGLLFIACSSLITGCSSFGFNSADDQCETCSPSSPVVSGTAQAKSTTLIAAKVESSESASALKVTQEKTQTQVASTSVVFKGPKALRDIQAISLDVSHGRKAQEIDKAATVFIKKDPKNNVQTPVAVASVSTAVAVAKVKQPEVEIKSVELSSGLSGENNVPVISSVEQVNRLIEETPTAAGIESAVVLNVPKAKIQPASQVINDSQLIDFGIWKIENNWDDKHPGECRLSTATMQIDQHDFTTQLWLTVVNDKLVVNSTMNIDIKQPGVGIKAGNGALQRFSEKVYSSNAVWSGNLAKTLKSNDQFRIILGGGELGKNTHETSIDLKGLKKGYSAYQACKG